MADGDEHLGRTTPQSQDNALAFANSMVNQQDVQAGPYYLNNSLSAPSPAPRTIVSGVERLKAAARGAEALLGEFDGFVLGMLGEGSTEAHATPDLPEGAGTVAVVHDAADAIEGVLACMAELVKRAKAAHG